MCSFWIFREPVDPVLLQIPTYFEVIPRRDARDLRTIRAKLDADKYDTADAWEADVGLMANNAVRFNGAESEVAQTGLRLLERARELLAGARMQATPAQGKKRAAGESPAGRGASQGSVKKIKIAG